MVHTDIKTKHFMRFGGEWKLVDYDNATMENETCQPSCTIRYAAPEVVAARVGAGVVKVTRAVDAWAMGHVLYPRERARRRSARPYGHRRAVDLDDDVGGQEGGGGHLGILAVCRLAGRPARRRA